MLSTDIPEHRATATCARSTLAALPGELAAIVGRRRVLTGARKTRRFRTGYRFGQGDALAVVLPGTLVELWRVAVCCASAGVVIVMQAANTGLTGGSTPDRDGYDRPVVVVSTLRIAGIALLGGGRQVLCLPGATLHALERTLAPFGREPHSVIGSSCFGASVIGGIANNSGGSLVRRGPAYTEMALFAQIDADSKIHLINRLGIELGMEPEEMLSRLESGSYSDRDVSWDGVAGHDADYSRRVRDIGADTPARYNGDLGCLFDASGSAGHVVIFAVRLDTFPAEADAKVLYVGTNEPDDLQAIRRLLLGDDMELPVAAEYLHRETFDLADVYGKDIFMFIEKLGTGRMPAVFAAKSRIDAACDAIPFAAPSLSDRLLQAISRLAPEHLPSRMRDFRDRFEHHLILKVGADAVDRLRRHLAALLSTGDGAFFECSAEEGRKAFLHRFVAAGAAVRYRAVHHDEVEDIVALDIALPRSAQRWNEVLPPAIDSRLVKKLYYGHFLCHVFHQDYIVAKGQDCSEIEKELLALLEARGGRAPAEHSHGHLYHAGPEVLDHYRRLDPCNCLNPGVGKTTKSRFWAQATD